MSIADKLLAVAENEQRVFDAGKLALLRSSKYMNATASGAVVAVNDVSPVEHDVGVKVASKNLLDNNTDKLTLQFNHTDYGYYIHLPAGTYTVHAEPLVDSFSEYLYHQALDENGVSVGNIAANYNCPVVGGKLLVVTFTVNVDFIYRLYCAGNGKNLDHAKAVFNMFNIQLEKGSTATNYTPYVEDLEGITVKRYGKNLLENNTDNLTFLENKNRYGYRVRLPAGTYTVHAEPIGEYINGIYIYHEAVDENEEKITDIGEASYNHPVVNTELSNVTFTVDREFYYRIYVAGTPDLDHAKTHFNTFNVQLEVANTATPYMPYIEPTTHTAAKDGTVDGVKSLYPSMTLATDTDGVTLDCSYLRDIDTYIDNLTMSVAMTGGD